MVDYEQALADASPCADAMRGGDDIASLFYTGGTTGRAKGVMLSHANLHGQCRNDGALTGTDESLGASSCRATVPSGSRRPCLHDDAGGRVPSRAAAFYAGVACYPPSLANGLRLRVSCRQCLAC